jgi:hypothetical protein
MQVNPITSNDYNNISTTTNNINTPKPTNTETEKKVVEQSQNLSRRDKYPDDEKWKYDLVNLLLKRAIYVPPKSFYSRFELFI